MASVTHATAQQMMVRGLIERQAATRFALTDQGARRAGGVAAQGWAMMKVRFRGQTGKLVLVLSFTVPDPGCVKTHTSAKCRKYNSPTRYQVVCTQHD